MDIEIKDTVALNDNNEYVVVSKINYQGNVYYYLIDKNDTKSIKFCMEKPSATNTLVEVNDEKLNRILLPLFVQKTKEHITSEDLEALN